MSPDGHGRPRSPIAAGLARLELAAVLVGVAWSTSTIARAFGGTSAVGPIVNMTSHIVFQAQQMLRSQVRG